MYLIFILKIQNINVIPLCILTNITTKSCFHCVFNKDEEKEGACKGKKEERKVEFFI